MQDLGITGLYLCPIFESTSNHKYNTTDYFEIDRHFGDKETFRKLVEQAHQRGMKIMLDAVLIILVRNRLNGKDVVKNGEQSAYKDWFHIQQFPVTTEKLVNKRDLPYHALVLRTICPS